MLKIYATLFLFGLFALNVQATDHTIVTQGLTYSPSTLNASIGDNITIVASGTHPTAEVSQATWNANGTAPLAGGFGTQTSSFTFTVETAGTIYYVCTSHVGSGMKGLINVLPTGLDEAEMIAGIEFGANPIKDNVVRFTLLNTDLIGATLELYSVDGKLLQAYRISSNSGTMTLNQANGNYLLVLRSADNGLLQTKKIVIAD